MGKSSMRWVLVWVVIVPVTAWFHGCSLVEKNGTISLADAGSGNGPEQESDAAPAAANAADDPVADADFSDEDVDVSPDGGQTDAAWQPDDAAIDPVDEEPDWNACPAIPPEPDRAPDEWPYPRLLFGSSDIPALAAKMGDGHVEKTAGEAMTALLRNQRDDASIRALLTVDDDPFNQNDLADPALQNDPYAAIFIYDFQHRFMTDAERTKGRKRIMADAEQMLLRAESRDEWYFRDGQVNNWTIWNLPDRTYHYLQRILLPAFLFPDDPLVPRLLAEGVRLYKALVQGVHGSLLTEEALNAINGYGAGNLLNAAHLIMAMHRHRDEIGFDPVTYGDCQLYHEGRFRTYVYQSVASAKSTVYGPDKELAGATHIYYVPLGGHAGYGPNGSWLSEILILPAGMYQHPVLTWLYFQSKGVESWSEVTSLKRLQTLFYHGVTQPISPKKAGWPLEAHFENAGVYVMRSGWEPDASVVISRSGWVGGHYQPCLGQVVFTGQGYTVLGKVGTKLQCYDCEPYGVFYKEDPRTNNILMVDGSSQEPDNGQTRRSSQGTLTVIDPQTIEMNPSAAYRSAGIDISWKRRVHYDRSRDLLLVEDTVSGGKSELMFNWVTENAQVIADDLVDLDGPYFMAVGLIEGPDDFRTVSTSQPTDEHFPMLQVTFPAGSVHVRWAIGPGQELVEEAALKP